MFKKLFDNENTAVTSIEEVKPYTKIKIPTPSNNYNLTDSDDDDEEKSCWDCAYRVSYKGQQYCQILQIPIQASSVSFDMAEDCGDYVLLQKLINTLYLNNAGSSLHNFILAGLVQFWSGDLPLQ